MHKGNDDPVVRILADVLTTLCEANDKIETDSPNINRFYSSGVPGISICEYLVRIKKYAQCTTPCFILALIYIDRLIQQQQTFLVCSLNVHRIIITSIMLSAKFYDDDYYNNRYYAKIGGIDGLEMNLLEADFLFMINFQLGVNIETYYQYCRFFSQNVQYDYLVTDNTDETYEELLHQFNNSLYAAKPSNKLLTSSSSSSTATTTTATTETATATTQDNVTATTDNVPASTTTAAEPVVHTQSSEHNNVHYHHQQQPQHQPQQQQQQHQPQQHQVAEQPQHHQQQQYQGPYTSNQSPFNPSQTTTATLQPSHIVSNSSLDSPPPPPPPPLKSAANWASPTAGNGTPRSPAAGV